MIELNVTNFITVGLMALAFFAAVEWGKKKFNMGSAEEAK